MKEVCVGFIILALFCSSCQAQQVRQENRYLSAIWSPDGHQTVYFRRFLEYRTTPQGPGIFIGEQSRQIKLTNDRLYLCINSADGKQEQVAAQIDYSLYQPDEYSIPDISTNITWDGQTILYGAGGRGWFSSGVRRLDLITKQDVQAETGFDSIIQLGHQLLRKNINGLELYSSDERGYGQINNQAIFIIDHTQRKISIYVSDPFLKGNITVPPYSITQP